MSGRSGSGGDRPTEFGWSLPHRVVLRVGRVLAFLSYFAGRLVVANLVVAREIITPRTGACPAVVHVPLQARTGTEIVLMALIVGLTPGTLTVAIRRRPPGLYVHGMHAADLVAFRRQLTDLERRLLLAIRPVRASEAGAGRSHRR